MHFQIEQSHTMDIQSYSLPASDRIKVYEQMYSSCMNTQSKLSTWIQSNKEKGPPSPLQEGYTPPTFKSKLTDYFGFGSSSHSTRRRRSLIPPETPDIKSSLSTLLKKATDSFSTTYSKQQHAKRKTNAPKLTIRTSPNTNQRFSLSNSFNRFSSSKHNYSISEETAAPPSPISFSSSMKHRKRLSTSIVEQSFSELKGQENTKRQTKRKSQFFSTPLPPSPTTSVFLEKLRPQNAECTQIDYGADIVITPPSSPSTIDSSTYMKQKKKRSSLLVAPSLSTLRFISPNFLRRQSLIV